MKLKEEQIEIIKNELRAKGVWYEPLQEDLLDHFCCEIEILMAEGMPFMDAYQKVLNRYNDERLLELNAETTNILNYTTMLRNVFTTALRLFKTHLSYSIIKLFSLSIGIAAFITALLYAKYEYSYDGFHKDSKSIYRMIRETEKGQIATTTFALVPTLRSDFPDYQFTHFFKDRSKTLFRKDEQTHYENNMIWADSDFLKFFDFEGFVGNPATALDDSYSVVFTEKAALKYFPRRPELGEVIEFKWGEKYYPLKLTGIIPEWPENMHIKFDILVSFKTTETVFPDGITDNWKMNYCYSYVKLPKGVEPLGFETQFENFINKYVEDQENDYRHYLGALQPLTSIHTQHEVLSNYVDVINPVYIQLALAIGLLILVITSLNFVTLNVAQFHARAREVGVRKSVGATRRHVIIQFLVETLMMVMAASFLAIGIVSLVLNEINLIMGTGLYFSLFYSGIVILAFLVLIPAITIATGLYPSIYFSTQNIITTISTKKGNAISFRRMLLTAQSLISAVLISFTFVIFDQLSFVRDMSPGYNKDQVIYIPHARRIRFNPETFKIRSLEHPSVKKVALSFYKPTEDMNFSIDVAVPGNEAQKITTTSVDEDFFETFEIDFTDGRNFTANSPNMNNEFIINESAVKYLDLKNPIGTLIKTEFSTGEPDTPVERREGKIIGVVKDVSFESFHHSIKPTIFLVKPYWYFYINVRLGDDKQGAISHLNEVWNEMFPDRDFEYFFLDSDFEQLYRKENQLAKGLTAMTILAILTTCLGLYGYVKYVIQQRTKEVGVRKVLGANYFQIANLLSRDFLGALLLANIISWPLVYFISRQWLQNFAFHVDLSALPLVITLLILLILSVATVYNQILKLAKVDLSQILRYD